LKQKKLFIPLAELAPLFHLLILYSGNHICSEFRTLNETAFSLVKADLQAAILFLKTTRLVNRLQGKICQGEMAQQ
jgi:hypothetical protein